MVESGTRRAVRRVKLWIRHGLSRLLGIVAACALLGGLGVFGWQVYHWVRGRIWPRVTVVDSLSWLDVTVRVPVPDSWTLVHRFVEWLPLSTTGVVGGTFLLILASGLRSTVTQAPTPLKDGMPTGRATQGY